jgi:hypothetical protein
VAATEVLEGFYYHKVFEVFYNNLSIPRHREGRSLLRIHEQTFHKRLPKICSFVYGFYAGKPKDLATV